MTDTMTLEQVRDEMRRNGDKGSLVCSWADAIDAEIKSRDAAVPVSVPEVTDRHLALAAIPSKYWDRAREAYALAARQPPAQEKGHE